MRARIAEDETESDVERHQAALALDIEIREAELALDKKLLMQLVERRHRMRRDMRFGRDVVILRKASP